MRTHLFLVSSLSVVLAAPPAFGQAVAPDDAGDATISGGAEQSTGDEDVLPEDANQIVVVATRIRGQVDAPQPPIAILDEGQIAAYGVSSLADLVTALSPQTSSGRGRGSGAPAILLNGQRIASFREMRNFSPESIKKVEVLPEEVALRFGFPPNQRVINFILKDNFTSTAVELDYRQPWAGGSSTIEVEGSLLRINGPRRLNLTVSTGDTTPLTEAERNVLQAAGSVPSVTTDPDPAAFRTLIADSREFDLTGSWATGLGEGARSGSLSFNAGVTVDDTRSLSGLDIVSLMAPDGSTALRALSDPLERRNRTVSAQGGAGLNTNLGSWLLTATLDASHSETATLIDRRADPSALIAAAANGGLSITGPLPTVANAGFDRAESNTDTANTLLTLIGRPLALPAGEVSTTLKAGYSYTAIDSRDTRSTVGAVRLDRGEATAGFNLGIPLTSRRDSFLGAVGDLTLNFSGGFSQLSDFGTLTDWSAGLTWAPTERLGLQATYIVNQAAPGLSDLGSPTTVTFNVPVYDFATGRTVLVTSTGGGNPALREEVQRDLKLSANWQLPVLSNSNLLVEYFRNRSENVTVGFPLLTPAIEAAFSGRVTRDTAGNLLAIDRRPITLAAQDSDRLRWGFNLAGSIGKAAPGGGGMMGGGRPGGRGGPGGPGGGSGGGMRGPGGGGGPGMMAMFGGGGQGRWNLGLYHTVRFREDVLIAPGGPVLDLLNGDALSGGGVARHSLELDGGFFHKGFGVRANGTYTSPTTIRATGAPGSSELEFGGLATVNLRVFVDLNQQASLIKAAPFLKGTRVSLRLDNLFDARQRVTDDSGTVPISYQPDLIDPRGRFVAIELRKQF